MTESSGPRIPEVYVLWHPACAVGEQLARQIHAWLRPGNGLGPDVFYRSIAAPGSEPGSLPLPLPGEHCAAQAAGGALRASTRHVNEQIVVLLVDDHMVADPAWRYWLAELAPARQAQPSTVARTFVPVALDATAYNLPQPLPELNFLRPAGLPAGTLADLAPGGAQANAMEKVTRSLLRQLTETLCKQLLGTGGSGGAAAAAGAAGATACGGAAPAAAGTQADAMQPKIAIFLSHAKADGTAPARRLRDYIYSQTQLAAFYDENDIPFGSAFARVLETSLRSSQTAAMIAVRSGRYASRPWCRRELALFRKPLRESAEDERPERWRLNPVLVVEALDPGARTLGIPEMGNATLIRWRDDDLDLEEQIVTTVLRDALLAAFHSSLGCSLGAPVDSVILNWLPDPTTLLRIPVVRDAAREVTVFYPGRGLSGLELDILFDYFPLLSFRSFDQAKP